MRKTAIAFLYLVIAGGVNAQLIDNSNGISMLEDPEFNPAFVRTNRIATITGIKSVKRVSDIIRPSHEKVVYHFDRAGRLFQVQQLTSPGRGGGTVTATIYRYDTDGSLIDKIMADVSGATSYSYEYNEQGRVVKETCSRMESPRDTLTLTGPKRTEIYSESFDYTELDNGYKTITSNNYGRPYKEAFFYFDQHGYLVEQSERYLMSNRMSKELFSYNERGLLKERTLINDLAKNDTVFFEYDYDETGNLYAARELKGEELIRKAEFLYDPKTWRLKARLIKVEETEMIRIVEYDTTYFEE